MLKIIPSETPLPKMHQYILGAVSPRPIAFASTMDKNGNPNLAPFSFFNAFGSNPPVVIFSPARSGRDNTTKHTLDNIEDTKEVVINIVNYNMVQQMSLTSSPYTKGVNEFIKSGLTPIESELVKPFRVKESFVQFECKLLDIVYTGDKGGAGNIIICEIILMHIDEKILDENGKIDPYKMDHVARMGGDYYTKVIPESIFILPQPKTECGIGVDVLPASIRNSKILTGNNLGQLGSFLAFPTKEEIDSIKDKIINLSEEQIHLLAKNKLDNGEALEGFKMLMHKSV
ncbi:MAG: flavin reductase family protein [Fimbriimonadaceae bacterium]|nr:flavin reductase family protein [Chitinophagales bacterium]